MKRNRLPDMLTPIAMAFLSCLMGGGAAQASTAAERKALQQAAPHLASGQGKMIRANWARVVNFGGNKEKRKESAQKLKAAYESCARAHRARPVHEWPSYQMMAVDDMYVTEFGQVTYGTMTMYLVDSTPEEGCHLKEFVTRYAEVRSPLGRCKVNMSEGRAQGVCKAYHERARKEMEKGGKGFVEPNPGIHPMSGLRETDEVRHVAGLPCRVILHTVGGIKSCMASSPFAGYQGASAVPLGGYTALMLSQELPGLEPYALASDGKMDIQVGRDLLFPFLAPGIQIIEERPAPVSWHEDDEP